MRQAPSPFRPAARRAMRYKRASTTILLFCSLCLLPSGCLDFDFGGEFTYSETGGDLSIGLAVESASSSSVVLAITANFNCDDVPVFRNGCLYGSTAISSGATTWFIDSQVSPGVEYSYQVGGYVFLGGEVWSNSVTVRVPY